MFGPTFAPIIGRISGQSAWSKQRNINDKYETLEEIYQKKKKINENSTVRVLTEVADSILDMISFTSDIPSNHSDGMLPVLDIKVKLDFNNEVVFDYFEKPTKTDQVILASSALSWRQKKDIHTNELIRRLRNTSAKLGESAQNHHLNCYMIRLKDAGYSSQFREMVVTRAKAIYRAQVENDQKGIKPLYRSRSQILADKQKKGKTNYNWWNKGSIKFQALMFVPPTPGGELMARLQKREAELNCNAGMRIKFIEQAGTKLKNRLVRADPFPSKECHKSLCPICKTTPYSKVDRKGIFWTNCTTKNVGYRIICQNCAANQKISSYEGETGRPIRVRLIEHLNGLRKQDPGNALFKHDSIHHPHANSDWKFEIVGVFKNALTRQANEAVRISSIAPESLVNLKSEFHHPPVNRIKVVK